MKAHREDADHVCIFCPGCREVHVLDSPSRWAFNEDYDSPTFTPSLLVRTGHYVTGQSTADCNICQNEPSLACTVCHSFIMDGQMQFLNDCTHSLAGTTVNLQEWAGFDPANYLKEPE